MLGGSSSPGWERSHSCSLKAIYFSLSTHHTRLILLCSRVKQKTELCWGRGKCFHKHSCKAVEFATTRSMDTINSASMVGALMWESKHQWWDMAVRNLTLQHLMAFSDPCTFLVTFVLLMAHIWKQTKQIHVNFKLHSKYREKETPSPNAYGLVLTRKCDQALVGSDNMH